MYISVSEAKAQLTDLVRRAESGDEVILTRHGHAAVRLVPIKAKPTTEEKRQILKLFRQSVETIGSLDDKPERASERLFGDDGMPA